MIRSVGRTAWVLAALALGAAACSGQQKSGDRRAKDEVILNVGGDPRTLDPGKSEDTVSARVIMSFIRGLTILDGKGAAQPELAERWTVSEDGKTWDFYLRDSKWSNGKPVTAEDFTHSWLNRMLNPEFAAIYTYILFYLEGAEAYFKRETTDPKTVGVEAVDAKHLRLRLIAPAPFLPQLLAHHAYYPVCAEADRANPDWALRAETYVSNGPFTLTQYSSGDRIAGVKNEGYWNAANVAMKHLTFRCIEEESTELIAFESGEIDGSYTAPRPDLERLKGEGTLEIAPQIATYYLNINMKTPVFADVRVRKALNLAIDRGAITKFVARAGERVAVSLVPPELYDGEQKEYFKDADYEEARRLLAEAGFPGGQGFPKLRYIYNTLEMHRGIAQAVQENWKRELGIEMTIENQEFKVLIENRHQGNYDIARNGWVADFADPLNFLEIFLSYAGNNDSKYNNPEFDRLTELARNEADPARRIEYSHQAEDVLMADFPFIPIYFYAEPYLRARDLEGSEVSPMRTIDVAKLRWKKSE